MIKAIIVDDEEKSRITLKNLLLRHCPEVDVVDLCASVERAEEAIRVHSPGLVFLDIEMPFRNGFTLVENIPEPGFEVIFTTAFDQYAIRAIRYSALDYLLKPVDVDELKIAIARAGKRKPSLHADQIELLMSALSLKRRAAKIAVPAFDGLQMIEVDRIVKCVADESYTHITLTTGAKITVSRILKEFEELLGDYNFMRVHNSSLINIIHVKKYVKGDGGYVIMSDDDTVEVARRKKNELLSRLAIVHL